MNDRDLLIILTVILFCMVVKCLSQPSRPVRRAPRMMVYRPPTRVMVVSPRRSVEGFSDISVPPRTVSVAYASGAITAAESDGSCEVIPIPSSTISMTIPSDFGQLVDLTVGTSSHIHSGPPNNISMGSSSMYSRHQARMLVTDGENTQIAAVKTPTAGHWNSWKGMKGKIDADDMELDLAPGTVLTLAMQFCRTDDPSADDDIQFRVRKHSMHLKYYTATQVAAVGGGTVAATSVSAPVAASSMALPPPPSSDASIVSSDVSDNDTASVDTADTAGSADIARSTADSSDDSADSVNILEVEYTKDSTTPTSSIYCDHSTIGLIIDDELPEDIGTIQSIRVQSNITVSADNAGNRPLRFTLTNGDHEEVTFATFNHPDYTNSNGWMDFDSGEVDFADINISELDPESPLKIFFRICTSGDPTGSSRADSTSAYARNTTVTIKYSPDDDQSAADTLAEEEAAAAQAAAAQAAAAQAAALYAEEEEQALEAAQAAAVQAAAAQAAARAAAEALLAEEEEQAMEAAMAAQAAAEAAQAAADMAQEEEEAASALAAQQAADQAAEAAAAATTAVAQATGSSGSGGFTSTTFSSGLSSNIAHAMAAAAAAAQSSYTGNDESSCIDINSNDTSLKQTLYGIQNCKHTCSLTYAGNSNKTARNNCFKDCPKDGKIPRYIKKKINSDAKDDFKSCYKTCKKTSSINGSRTGRNRWCYCTYKCIKDIDE